MRLRLLPIAGLLLLMTVPDVMPANAHSQIARSSPAAGSTMAAPPREVVVWFSRNIEVAYSQIEVRNSDGEPVHDGKSKRDPADRKKLSVPLKPLTPGTYKVFWRALSVDTHKLDGSFVFRVAQ